MKSVLFVAPFDGISGGILRWAEHVMAYYKSLRNTGFIISPFSIGRSHFVNINQSVFLRLYYALLDYVSIIVRFIKTIKHGHYDIVHIASSASISLLKDLIMIKIAHRRGAKSIIHFHFGRIPQLFEQCNWEYKLLCAVVKKADAVIVLDKMSYDTLLAKGYGNVALLPNPLASDVKALIKQYEQGIHRIPGKLLFVGHVVRTKGVFELVDACKSISGINLFMIGYVEPSVKSELIKASGDADWLHIIGEMPYENVIKEMLSCDMFILPTYSEGFPNVILESMACGCAIIASNVGAIPEMLKDDNGNSCGILISPQDVNDLKNAILTYKNNSELKSTYGINAKKCVEERYSMDVVWNRMTEIWNVTLNR